MRSKIHTAKCDCLLILHVSINSPMQNFSLNEHQAPHPGFTGLSQSTEQTWGVRQTRAERYFKNTYGGKLADMGEGADAISGEFLPLQPSRAAISRITGQILGEKATKPDSPRS